MSANKILTDPSDMSSLRLDDTTVTNSAISALEALPEEIRKEILRYVLHTRYARLDNVKRKTKKVHETQLTGIGHMRVFDWNVGVLRVCKTMYNDGITILRNENRWIKFTTDMNFDVLRHAFRNYDVHVIEHLHTSILKHHVAEVYFTSSHPQWSGTQDQVFLLPQEDLQAFCNCLECIDMNNHLRFRFKFKIENKLSKSAQRQILKPFCVITGEQFHQSVSLEGQISEAVVKQVKASMTLRVDWIRVKAWEMFACVEKLKDAADKAVSSGDWSAAVYKYGQATRSWDVALRLNPTIEDDMCYDQECKKAQWDLDTIIFINHLIAAIHAKQMEGFFTGTDGLKKTKEWISYRRMKSVSPQLKALLAFVKGVGTVHASEPSVAAELFDYAMELYPDEHMVYRKCKTIAKKYSSSSKEEQASQRAKLISYLPPMPISTPLKHSYLTDLAASERYVCTQLGHHGKFPEEVMNLIKDGISLRLDRQGQNPEITLHMLPLQGRGALNPSDIDLIEVLLFDRIKGNRTLCQAGHVDPALLDNIIADPRTRVGQAARQLQAAQDQEWGPKVYISLSDREIGRRSASQNEPLRRNLLNTWPGLAAKYKSKIEKVVEEIVHKHKNVFK